jgi:hypothetical protein
MPAQISSGDPDLSLRVRFLRKESGGPASPAQPPSSIIRYPALSSGNPEVVVNGDFADKAESGSTRIGYSRVMIRFDPTNAHAVPRGAAIRDEVYAPVDVTGQSIRVVGG